MTGAIEFSAPDHGYLTWSHRPTECASSGQVPAPGQLQLVRVHLPAQATVTNVVLYVQSVTGVALTAGQCTAGLYDAAGSLLSATGDESGAWTSSGTKVIPLLTPQISLAAGDYYIGFYANGGVLPAFAAAAASFPIVNTGLAASAARYATGAGGLKTSMPGSAGTLVAATSAFWAALS